MKNIALIPAAGSGNRMGKKQKKQFLNLAGQPMLTRTILLFQNCHKIDEIVLVTPEEDMEYCQKEIIAKNKLNKVTKIIPGGENRGQSVFNGIKAIKPESESIVLIHDGARPLLSDQLVINLIKYLRINSHKDGVIPILPVKDTIKVVKDDIIEETPPRKYLYAVQTPQCFYLNSLKEALDKVSEILGQFTDESSIMEYLNYNIATIAGEEDNFKITTPHDLLLAEYVLTRRKK